MIDLTMLKFDDNGLIPAIIQDAANGTVLMLAYMNSESLEKTIKTGFTWFYSRSRQSLWNKGETSGYVQKVENILYDCDQDTLLVQVKQTGAACHTGHYSCFYRNLNEEETDLTTGTGERLKLVSDDFAVLSELSALITERKQQRPQDSYTTYLFDQGLDKILKKIGEEAAEVIIAAKNTESEELVYETADLLYHLQVLMAQKEISWAEVLAELRSRR